MSESANSVHSTRDEDAAAEAMRSDSGAGRAENDANEPGDQGDLSTKVALLKQEMQMDDMAHRMQLEHMKTTFSEQLGAMSEELKVITLRAERAEAELHAVQAVRPQDGDGDGYGSGVTLASMQAKYDALLQARASDAEEAARALAAERDEREVVEGEDPDLAGIVPGPQPTPEWLE